MIHGRCGSIISNAFSCLLIFTFLSVFAVEAGQWNTDGAHRAFLKAERERSALVPVPNASISKYLSCVQTYRKVYINDPHYENAADAVYYEGLVYQKMGDLFKKNSYYHRAVKRFQFLVSDYGGNTNCPDALSRIGEIYTQKLNNQPEARKAYKTLRTQYEHTKIQPPSIPVTPAREAAPQKQAILKKRETKASTAQKARIHNIRFWSSRDYTRMVIDMDSDALYKKELLRGPDRMYFDILNASLNEDLHNQTFPIKDAFLKQVRVAQNNPSVVRIVLDFSTFSTYSVFKLQDPCRIVIDLHHHPNKQIKISKPQPVNIAATGPATSPDTKLQAEPGTASLTMPKDPLNPKSPPQEMKSPTTLGKTVSLAGLIRKDLPDSPKAAAPTSYGKRTLTRMLGLKIGRIVIDPGHGGHDLGTVGPEGMLEKDLVLSMAFRLKKMLEQKLGAEVVLTRNKDIFVSLEERTKIANQNRADLFVSIHANSSRSSSTSGVETYYLDFAKTNSERVVAARENAGTGRSISDLENLVEQITKADKSAESKELASIIQKRLYRESKTIFPSTRDRGVRRAPFVVLIGANMPSILTEVAFISNPKDEKALNKEQNRNHLADALFAGIEDYMKTMGSYPIAYRTVQNK